MKYVINNHIYTNMIIYYTIRHQTIENFEIIKIILTNKITETFYTDVAKSVFITYFIQFGNHGV